MGIRFELATRGLESCICRASEGTDVIAVRHRSGEIMFGERPWNHEHFRGLHVSSAPEPIREAARRAEEYMQPTRANDRQWGIRAMRILREWPNPSMKRDRVELRRDLARGRSGGLPAGLLSIAESRCMEPDWS
jgi:hypothetical protein